MSPPQSEAQNAAVALLLEPVPRPGCPSTTCLPFTLLLPSSPQKMETSCPYGPEPGTFTSRGYANPCSTCHPSAQDPPWLSSYPGTSHDLVGCIFFITSATTASHMGLFPGPAAHDLDLCTSYFVSLPWKSVPSLLQWPQPFTETSPESSLPLGLVTHPCLPPSSFLLSVLPLGKALHRRGLSCSLLIPSARGQYGHK